ncbi:MAG: OsmC family protein [Rhodobacteraceae bacterium]|nr:OsmC family protein [Paracoccaceae bacterium]
MALKMKAKPFGPVYVIFDGSDTFQYAYKDVANATPHPPVNSPVDTMLASLGSCIVKSVQWAADQQKVAPQPFQVKVEGLKSLDLPGRVETATITVEGAIVEDAQLAEKIVKQAKSVCTVSNSLTTTVEIVIDAG